MHDFRTDVRSILQSRKREKIIEEGGKAAGVLLPFFKRANSVYVLFTLRTQSVASHKGHVSFPGGGSEDGDRNICETALRETFEEVGINPSDVEVLGKLDDVIAVSDHVVTPVVGIIPHPYRYTISADEIEEIIEAPLDFFKDSNNCRTEMKSYRGKQVKVYYYQYGGHTIWGLTAYILRSFLEVCYGIPK